MSITVTIKTTITKRFRFALFGIVENLYFLLQTAVIKVKEKKRPIKRDDDQTKLQEVDDGKGMLSLLGSAHMPLWLIRQVIKN